MTQEINYVLVLKAQPFYKTIAPESRVTDLIVSLSMSRLGRSAIVISDSVVIINTGLHPDLIAAVRLQSGFGTPLYNGQTLRTYVYDHLRQPTWQWSSTTDWITLPANDAYQAHLRMYPLVWDRLALKLLIDKTVTEFFDHDWTDDFMDSEIIKNLVDLSSLRID